MNSHSELWWFREQGDGFALGFSDARSDFGGRKERAENGPVRTASEQAEYLRGLIAPHVHAPILGYMSQVHGNTVATLKPGITAEADALIVDEPGRAALVRVADCVPIVIVAPGKVRAAVVHAGRVGMTLGIISKTVEAMRQRGAVDLVAWVGPRACGECYEVPADMREEVAAIEPTSFSQTSWGTPAIDVGAGVVAQLQRVGVLVHDIGARVCTIEDERFWSYRRQGSAAGRFGAYVELMPRSHHD